MTPESPEAADVRALEEVKEELPVMLWYEEPDHLRLLIRTKTGIVTRWMDKENTETMMKWIGAKGTATKSDIITTV